MREQSALPSPDHVQIDHTRVATYVLEPDSTPHGEVVLCHGTPWSAATWMPVARVLAERYRVFLWDMPGYGASINDAGTPVDLDLIHQQRRLAALLDRWGLERPHLLAHDIGGAVALGAHLRHGRDFASLHLVDIVTLDPWGSPFFRLVAANEAVFADLPPNLHAALVREYIGGAAGDALEPGWVDELAEPWLSPSGQRAFYRQIAQLRPEHTRPIAARLAEVRCPVRIGWGENDPWIPVAQASRLAARLPGAVEVITFPGAGHLVPLEATHALTHDVLAWLRAVPGDP